MNDQLVLGKQAFLEVPNYNRMIQLTVSGEPAALHPYFIQNTLPVA